MKKPNSVVHIDNGNISVPTVLPISLVLMIKKNRTCIILHNLSNSRCIPSLGNTYSGRQDILLLLTVIWEPTPLFIQRYMYEVYSPLYVIDLWEGKCRLLFCPLFFDYFTLVSFLASNMFIEMSHYLSCHVINNKCFPIIIVNHYAPGRNTFDMKETFIIIIKQRRLCIKTNKTISLM